MPFNFNKIHRPNLVNFQGLRLLVLQSRRPFSCTELSHFFVHFQGKNRTRSDPSFLKFHFETLEFSKGFGSISQGRDRPVSLTTCEERTNPIPNQGGRLLKYHRKNFTRTGSHVTRHIIKHVRIEPLVIRHKINHVKVELNGFMPKAGNSFLIWMAVLVFFMTHSDTFYHMLYC